jgi:phosphoribosylformylglycinamidine synthase
MIESAHDVSDGGLFLNLMESAMVNSLGFSIESDEEVRKDAFLFGEAQSRIVVSVSSELQEAFVEFMAVSEVPFSLLGTVTDAEVFVDNDSWGSTESLSRPYHSFLPELMHEQPR